MTIIATLVTTKPLTAGDLSALADALMPADTSVHLADQPNPGAPRFGGIVDGCALDLHWETAALPQVAGENREARAHFPALRAWLEAGCRAIGLAADPFVQHAAERARSAFIADMDSTMITVECIDELAARVGVGEQVAAITERAMRGELDFAASLKERVALLAGLDPAVITELLHDRVRPSPGSATLVATLRAHGIATRLASGGFHAFADPVARALGFDDVVANRLQVIGRALSGRVLAPIVDAEAKAQALRALCASRPCAPSAAIAIGDGANDMAMLAQAGLAIAYRAKPRLRAIAHGTIDHGNLTAVLYALGLPHSAWVERSDPRFD